MGMVKVFTQVAVALALRIDEVDRRVELAGVEPLARGRRPQPAAGGTWPRWASG